MVAALGPKRIAVPVTAALFQEAADEALVHHHDVAPAVVRGCERTPFQHAEAHGGEVVPGHGPAARQMLFRLAGHVKL